MFDAEAKRCQIWLPVFGGWLTVSAALLQSGRPCPPLCIPPSPWSLNHCQVASRALRHTQGLCHDMARILRLHVFFFCTDGCLSKLLCLHPLCSLFPILLCSPLLLEAWCSRHTKLKMTTTKERASVLAYSYYSVLAFVHRLSFEPWIFLCLPVINTMGTLICSQVPVGWILSWDNWS